MKRISLIQTAEGELCQDFKSKCHTFIKAMYSKPSEISQDINTSNTQEGTQGIWHNLSDNEVKQAIFTSLPKKAPGSDRVSFAIIQEAYKAIAEVINLVYKILIKADFHPQC